MKKLIYTIAFDAPGQSLYRNLAKLLASSILRSGFNGEIVVFHNSANPLFLLQRAGIIEYPLDVENVTGDGMSFHPEKTWALKHLVANLLHEHDWDRCYFIDADAIVLENLEPLFLGDWEVAVCREPGRALTRPEFSKFLTLSTHNASDLEGINSGIVGVDRSVSERFFATWTENETNLKCDERACTDQIALNQLTLENNFQLFDVGHLISMPFHTDLLWGRPKRVLLEHMVGAIGHEKLKRSFGAFMETYYYDPTVTLFNLLET